MRADGRPPAHHLIAGPRSTQRFAKQNLSYHKIDSGHFTVKHAPGAIQSNWRVTLPASARFEARRFSIADQTKPRLKKRPLLNFPRPATPRPTKSKPVAHGPLLGWSAQLGRAGFQLLLKKAGKVRSRLVR